MGMLEYVNFDSVDNGFEAENNKHSFQFINSLANVFTQGAVIKTGQKVKKVEESFDSEADLIGVIIIDENSGQLLGMISRQRFMELYSKPFRKDLYNSKPLKMFVEDDFNKPLCLKETDSIDHAVRMALSRPKDQMYDPVVVYTSQGSFRLIDVQVLLLELAKAHERQSQELQHSLSKVNHLNAKLEESQERILESLNCASVIQESILPRKELFDRLFSEWFTIYHPKDVVGGDLYWLRNINGYTLLAVIDCTGHGVPGAFMTMTVNSVLNHIVDTHCFDDPARILSEMNRVLRETLSLRRDGESLVDAGLDIAICCIDPKQRTLKYASAGLSIYQLNGKNLYEVRGDRAGIGYSGSDLNYQYTNHDLNIGPGDSFYITTDGFLDENGGNKGFGFGRDRFKKMLEKYVDCSLEDQKQHFEQTLASWRGSRNQRDDITLVGFQTSSI